MAAGQGGLVAASLELALWYQRWRASPVYLCRRMIRLIRIIRLAISSCTPPLRSSRLANWSRAEKSGV